MANPHGSASSSGTDPLTSHGNDNTILRVLMTTWNVGNAEPENLRALITSKDYERLDMIVVGVQEARYQARASDRKTPHANDIMEGIKLALGEKWYSPRIRGLGEMQLGVFMLTSLKLLVKDIHASVERAGVADVGSNKGGIAIRLTIGHTSFAFVSAHLAAHEGIYVFKMKEKRE